MPALPPYLIEPIWEQFRALLPERKTNQPLGGHRERPGQSSHDSPLLVPTLEAASGALGALPEGTSVHLDRGYDSQLTRERLEDLGLRWEISGKGKPAPFWATNRWVVERTGAWQAKLAHKKLVWCTERVGRVDRLLGCLLRRGDHRKAAHPRRLDALPLGGTTIPTTMSPIDGSSKLDFSHYAA